MPVYKLYYFDAPARGELPRLLLSAAGQPFEDVRFSREEWPQYKPRMPLGQVPVLEIDGEMLCQEYAICRYIAKEFGLCNESNLDQAREDMVVFTSEDIYVQVEEIFHCYKDLEKAAVLTKKWVEESGPCLLSKVEGLLGSSKSGYFVGDKMSYADIAIFSNVSVMEFILPKESVSLLEKCPKLKKNMDLVRSSPNISAYLKKRKVPTA